MTQIPLDRLTMLFSSTRLNGYTDAQEHEENLALIGTISHKIGILEIVLRNSVDRLMRDLQGQDWLMSLPSGIEPKGELQAQKRDKFISTQSLGFWVKIVEHYKIHNKIFHNDFLGDLNFKKYYPKNKNRFSRGMYFRDYHKVSAILQLLRLIRNRAFHFENLYKMNEKGPRLSVKIYNNQNEYAIFSVQPNKIIHFLNDLITSFDKRLITYGENVW